MFYLKLLTTFIVSFLIYKYMEMIQKKKEEKAERIFQRTLKEIEDRNKMTKGKEYE
jgi:ribosomal protein S7